MPAFLGNEVPADASAHNLSERYGWHAVTPDGSWMGYNLGPDMDQNKINQVIKMIEATDPHYSTKN